MGDVEEIQLVVFLLGKEEYGMNIKDTREIIKTMEITRIPNTPDFISGLINLRGSVVVVVDMRKRFGLPMDGGKHIIVVEISGGLFGIVVNEVTEILRVNREMIKKTPKTLEKTAQTKYLKGVMVLGERLIILMDVNKILSDNELSLVTDVKSKLSSSND